MKKFYVNVEECYGPNDSDPTEWAYFTTHDAQDAAEAGVEEWDLDGPQGSHSTKRTSVLDGDSRRRSKLPKKKRRRKR